MVSDQRPSHDELHSLRNQLTTMRGAAQLLQMRLQRGTGDPAGNTEICQIIIDQTRVVERLLMQVATQPQEPKHRLVVDREFSLLQDHTHTDA